MPVVSGAYATKGSEMKVELSSMPGPRSRASWVPRRRAFLLAASAAAWVLLAASSARASTVTVGQLFAPDGVCPANSTLLQSSLSQGTSVVPSPGLITSWSFQDGAATVTGLKLKVARAAGGFGNYTIVAESAAGTQTPFAVNTYQAAIPVQAGDIIGIYENGGGNCETTTATTPADFAYERNLTDAPPGSTLSYTPFQGVKFPVSASVQPTPGIIVISPTSGSVSGGTSVTVAGHDFTGASAVSFGGVPARSFTVDSDYQITASTPRSASTGPVDVSVTSAAGTSPAVAGDRFTYTGCVVPNLKGNKLKVDKKKLGRADCRLGKVRGQGNKVKRQSVKPGTVLPPGSKVNVKLG
jgi:hypothetical protein